MSASRSEPSSDARDGEPQYAWPFEQASEIDRFAHMADAHDLFSVDEDLHAQSHRFPAFVPHEHLTPMEALMLQHMPARDADG